MTPHNRELGTFENDVTWKALGRRPGDQSSAMKAKINLSDLE